jgi:signal recognition particle receptor subunit alpha
MLDSFEILTTSGVVLWSRSYAPVGPNIINALITDVFIEEKVRAAVDDSAAVRYPAYKREKYTLKWTAVKELGLIFVVRQCPNFFRSEFCD